MALVPDTLKSVRDSSGEVGIEWLAGDDRFEGSQQRYALLPEGGKIDVATNVANGEWEELGQGCALLHERRS